jgi:hypothetical protein
MKTHCAFLTVASIALGGVLLPASANAAGLAAGYYTITFSKNCDVLTLYYDGVAQVSGTHNQCGTKFPMTGFSVNVNKTDVDPAEAKQWQLADPDGGKGIAYTWSFYLTVNHKKQNWSYYQNTNTSGGGGEVVGNSQTISGSTINYVFSTTPPPAAAATAAIVAGAGPSLMPGPVKP